MEAYSLKKQAFYLLLGRIITYFIASISPIIFVRLLTTEDYGIYRQILLISAIALPLMRFRIPQSFYYFFPRANEDYSKLLSQSMFVLFIASFIGAVIFWILGQIFHFLPSGIGTEYVFPIAIYLFLESLAYIIDHIFVLEKKSKLIPLLSISNGVLRLSLIIAAIISFKSVIAIVYALIIFSGVRLAVLVGYLINKYTIRFGILDRKLLNDQVRYTGPLAASGIVGVIGNYFEKGVISALMSAKDFAIYSIGGLGIMNAITLIYTSIGDVSIPKFGSMAVENNLEGIKTLWHKMITINAVITIPVASFCFAFAEQIITFLFTEKYILSANILRINLLILIIEMLGYGYIPRALGKTKEILIGNTVRASFIMLMSFYLISKMGLLGGAVSFVIGFWLNAITQLYAGKKALKVKINKFLPWKKLLNIFLISISLALFLPYIAKIGLSNIIILMVGALFYFTAVTALFILVGYLNIKDIKAVIRKE